VYPRRVSGEATTLLVERRGSVTVVRAPRFALEVVAGPDRGARAQALDGKLTVGSAEGVTLRLSDPTVSRFHAELEAGANGITVRDLGSTNGTRFADALVREVTLTVETELAFGRTRVRLSIAGAHDEVETSGLSAFGEMIGASPAMRRLYLLLERAAPTTAPVLITGESGTGKELAARALHEHSPRREGPFEIVDCGGLPPTLVEAELFGHERGAFTGADVDRQGAFERADGGTLFLDELGELPLELQPKLLRALGEGEVRRLGSQKRRKVDVRVVAATNRDLRSEVNAGRFRADLYYRLAVIHLELPPLRQRLEDLLPLVRALLERISRERGVRAHFEPDEELLAELARHGWPGNVRELRNYLEQLVILRMRPALGQPEAQTAVEWEGLLSLPLRAAKDEIVTRFERSYLEHLLRSSGGNVAEAARRAGVDRGTLFRTIRRHGMKVPRE